MWRLWRTVTPTLRVGSQDREENLHFPVRLIRALGEQELSASLKIIIIIKDRFTDGDIGSGHQMAEVAHRLNHGPTRSFF